MSDLVEHVAQALLAVFEVKEQFSEEECPRAFARAAINSVYKELQGYGRARDTVYDELTFQSMLDDAFAEALK